jgi:hypothetical protein
VVCRSDRHRRSFVLLYIPSNNAYSSPFQWPLQLSSAPILHTNLRLVSFSIALTTDASELESVRIQLNKANYDLSNVKTESERTKLRYESMIRDRDIQILAEQKKSEDLQKDRKFLFDKQQSNATELLTVQDEFADYKVATSKTVLMIVGSRSEPPKFAKGK